MRESLNNLMAFIIRLKIYYIKEIKKGLSAPGRVEAGELRRVFTLLYAIV